MGSAELSQTEVENLETIRLYWKEDNDILVVEVARVEAFRRVPKGERNREVWTQETTKKIQKDKSLLLVEKGELEILEWKKDDHQTIKKKDQFVSNKNMWLMILGY